MTPEVSSTQLINVVGAVETRADRCIAFPNTYQHRVSSFRLVDPTKPGYRKILCLFLVDPAIPPIPSTTHVPAQQASWHADAPSSSSTNSQVEKLSPEVLPVIGSGAELIDDREAKKIRLELMKERTAILEFAEEYDDDDDDEYTKRNLFARTFNLCEH